MWNLQSINSICHLKNQIEDQRKHLHNLDNVKASVDNREPVNQTTKRILSFKNNKYTKLRDIQIYKDNQILLSKMMNIEKKDSGLNHKRLTESHFFQDSLLTSYNKFSNKKIFDENQALYKRLRSANSQYKKENWQKGIKQMNEWKRNISVTHKKTPNIDLTELVRSRDGQSTKSLRVSKGDTGSRGKPGTPLSYGYFGNERIFLYSPKIPGNREEMTRPYTAPKDFNTIANNRFPNLL